MTTSRAMTGLSGKVCVCIDHGWVYEGEIQFNRVRGQTYPSQESVYTCNLITRPSILPAIIRSDQIR